MTELHPRGLHGRSDLDRHADALATLAGFVRRAFIDKCETLEGSRCANTPTPIRPPVEEANGHG